MPFGHERQRLVVCGMQAVHDVAQRRIHGAPQLLSPSVEAGRARSRMRSSPRRTRRHCRIRTRGASWRSRRDKGSRQARRSPRPFSARLLRRRRVSRTRDPSPGERSRRCRRPGPSRRGSPSQTRSPPLADKLVLVRDVLVERRDRGGGVVICGSGGVLPQSDDREPTDDTGQPRRTEPELSRACVTRARRPRRPSS